MKRSLKKVLSVCLASTLTAGICGVSSLGCLAEPSSVSASSTYMKYFTQMTDAAFNVQGIINGSAVSSTCGDGGFESYIKTASSDLVELLNCTNGVEQAVTGLNLSVTQNLSFVQDGKYVKVQYVVRNTSGTVQTVSLASGADVEIAGDDGAPITEFSDGSGFYMVGNDVQLNFIGKNNSDVTNVDTFWFGRFGDYNKDSNIIFTQTNATSFNAGDSAMGFSWKDRVVPANGSQTFSVLLGVGAPDKAPSMTLTSPSSAFPDSCAGSTVSFSGSVADEENTTGTEIYSKIDSLDPAKVYTFSGVPGTYTANISLPANLSVGAHTITIYAKDSGGAVSQVVTKTINILAPSGAHDITGISSLPGAVIGTDTITASVDNSVSTLALTGLTPSANASCKLYSDSACTSEITDTNIPLAVGVNTLYVKVTAQDSSVKTYTITITRAAAATATATTTTATTTTSNPKTNDAGSAAVPILCVAALLSASYIVTLKKKKEN